MSIFDPWSAYIIETLKAESDLAGSLLNHSGELGSTREAMVRNILGRILPSEYEIGTGEIVDLQGNHSKQIDIVISRRDFPSLSLVGGSKVFLIESVLATIEVKSTLTHKTMFEALDNSASVAELSPNIIAGTRGLIAKKMGLKQYANGEYSSSDPLATARFNLIGRPPSYIFSFKGYKKREDDLAQCIADWIDLRNSQGKRVSMHILPAVIAAEGCVAWRNSIPYEHTANFIMSVGNEAVPLRLLILHLLYTLIRKIPPTPDSQGIKPNLDAYLQAMAHPPTQVIMVGQNTVVAPPQTPKKPKKKKPKKKK